MSDQLNKPQSLSIRHYIQKQISVKHMIEEEIVEDVILHCGKKFVKSLDTCKSLEFSGLGKLLFRDSRAKKDIIKFENILKSYNKRLETASDKDQSILLKRIASAQEVLNYLKSKVNEQT